MSIQKYKIKEYGYLEKDFSIFREKKNYISIINDNNKKIELSKLYTNTLLTLVDSEINSKNTINENMPRFYQLPLIKKSLGKIKFYLYWIEDDRIKRVSLSKNTIFNKIKMFSNFISKNRDLNNKQLYFVDKKYEKIKKIKSNDAFIDVAINLNDLIVTPFESLDLVLNVKDHEMISFMYMEGNKSGIKQLVSYVGDLLEDNDPKIRENLRNVIKIELFVDAYKNMLKNNMDILRNIYDNKNDIEIYSEIIEIMMRTFPNGIYMFLEDNKFEPWMDKNLKLVILEKMSYDKMFEMSLTWNSRNNMWTSCIEHTMLFTKDLINQHKLGLNSFENGFSKLYQSLINNITVTAHENKMIEYSSFVKYAKEIKEIIDEIEDKLTEENSSILRDERYSMKKMSYIYHLSEIFKNTQELLRINPNIYDLEDTVKKKTRTMFIPKILIDDNGNAKLNTYVFNLDLKKDVIFSEYLEEENIIEVSLSKRMAPFINFEVMGKVLKFINKKTAAMDNIKLINSSEDNSKLILKMKDNIVDNKSFAKVIPEILMLIRQEVEIDIEQQYLSSYIAHNANLKHFIRMINKVKENGAEKYSYEDLKGNLFNVIRLKSDGDWVFEYEYNILYKDLLSSSIFENVENVENLSKKIHAIHLSGKLNSENKSETKVKRKI